jgi:hypothetical protein
MTNDRNTVGILKSNWKILAFFEHIEQYKQELETLISWNFHIPKTQTTFYWVYFQKFSEKLVKPLTFSKFFQIPSYLLLHHLFLRP